MLTPNPLPLRFMLLEAELHTAYFRQSALLLHRLLAFILAAWQTLLCFAAR